MSTRGSIGRDFSDAIHPSVPGVGDPGTPIASASGFANLRRVAFCLSWSFYIVVNCKVLINSVIFKLLVSTGIMTRRLLGWRTLRKPMCWLQEKMLTKVHVEHEASSHQGSSGWWLSSAL